MSNQGAEFPHVSGTGTESHSQSQNVLAGQTSFPLPNVTQPHIQLVPWNEMLRRGFNVVPFPGSNIVPISMVRVPHNAQGMVGNAIHYRLTEPRVNPAGNYVLHRSQDPLNPQVVIRRQNPTRMQVGSNRMHQPILPRPLQFSDFTKAANNHQVNQVVCLPNFQLVQRMQNMQSSTGIRLTPSSSVIMHQVAAPDNKGHPQSSSISSEPNILRAPTSVMESALTNPSTQPNPVWLSPLVLRSDQPHQNISTSSPRAQSPRQSLQPSEVKNNLFSSSTSQVVQLRPATLKLPESNQTRAMFVAQERGNVYSTGFPRLSSQSQTPTLPHGLTIRNSASQVQQPFHQLPGLNFNHSAENSQDESTANSSSTTKRRRSGTGSGTGSARKRKAVSNMSVSVCDDNTTITVVSNNANSTNAQGSKGTAGAGAPSSKRKSQAVQSESHVSATDANMLNEGAQSGATDGQSIMPGIDLHVGKYPTTTNRKKKLGQTEKAGRYRNVADVASESVYAAKFSQNPSPALQLIHAEIKLLNELKAHVRVVLNTEFSIPNAVYVFDVYVFEKVYRSSIKLQLTEDYPAEIPMFLNLKSTAVNPSTSNKLSKTI